MEVVQSPSVLFGPPFHSWFVPTLCRNLNPPSGKFSYAMWGLVFSIVPSVSAHIAPIACPPVSHARRETGQTRTSVQTAWSYCCGHNTLERTYHGSGARSHRDPDVDLNVGVRGHISPHQSHSCPHPQPAPLPLLPRAHPCTIHLLSPTPRLQSTPPSLARPTVHVASPPPFPLGAIDEQSKRRYAQVRPSKPKFATSSRRPPRRPSRWVFAAAPPLKST